MSKKDNIYSFKEFCELTAPSSCLGEDGLPTDEYRWIFRKEYLGLDRFIEAQDRLNTYQTALEEVKAGKKKTHWIWFIFPQMSGLGKSKMSKYYGIDGRDEAIEYIHTPILRDRLVEITEAVYNNEKSVYEIFGNDAVKVRSCMLLFASVSDIPIFKKMISKYSWK